MSPKTSFAHVVFAFVFFAAAFLTIFHFG